MRPLGLAVGIACLVGSLAPAAAQAMIPAQSQSRAAVGAAAALPAGARVTGALPGATALTLELSLAPRDPAALDAYAAAVVTPGSPVYHHFLTVPEFAAAFGPSAADIQTLRATLVAEGLAPGALADNHLELSVSATAATAAAALSTDLEQVHLPDGADAVADTVAPSLPTGVAPLLTGVSGLSTLPIAAPSDLQDPGLASPQSAGGGPGSCVAASAYGTTPAQIGAAYGLSGLWSAGDLGSGSAVALFELEPFTASDVAAYQACYGTSATVSTRTVGGGPTAQTQSGEAALDIEDVAGLAPRSAIVVYQAPNTYAGIVGGYQAIVTDDRAKVVSTSWGECEAQAGSLASAEHSLFAEAAAQGQTVLAAAGDSGADDCRTHSGAAVDDPASQADVTGVGGTSLPNYLAPGSETVWNDAYGAGGGGVSALTARPSWQTSAAIPQTAVSCGSGVTTCRELPDVSADADPATGYPVYFGGAWHEYGGTSAAAPTWAALLALADASSACAGTPVGFLNPILYTLPETDFYDTASGSNTFDGVTGYTARSGYDMASGLGAPNGTRLVPALCAAGRTTSTGTSSSGSTSTATTTTTTSATTTSATTTTTRTISATTPPPVATPPTTTRTSASPTTTSTPTVTHPSPPAPSPPPARVVVFDAPAAARGHTGKRLEMTVSATDRAGLALSYLAVGLPTGLRIDPSDGTVSGTPTRPGSSAVTVQATDTRGNFESVAVQLTITGRAAANRHGGKARRRGDVRRRAAVRRRTTRPGRARRR